MVRHYATVDESEPPEEEAKWELLEEYAEPEPLEDEAEREPSEE